MQSLEAAKAAVIGQILRGIWDVPEELHEVACERIEACESWVVLGGEKEWLWSFSRPVVA